MLIFDAAFDDAISLFAADAATLRSHYAAYVILRQAIFAAAMLMPPLLPR